MVVGVGGILLPGPVGSPFLVLGGLILFPRLFKNADKAFAERFPKTHKEGVRQVKRFVSDLERRYPYPR